MASALRSYNAANAASSPSWAATTSLVSYIVLPIVRGRAAPLGVAPSGWGAAQAQACAPDQASAATSVAISSPASVGLRPTRAPAAVRASILAWAVPLPPETIAPAWPIFLPDGAVTPAM